MSELSPCPCGKTPTDLFIQEGSSYRWRIISGNCCGEWMIESSRIGYGDSDDEIKAQCIEDWNNAVRAK